MTAVLRFGKLSFANTIEKDGGTLLGIDGGSLYALKNHNERKAISQRFEVRSKRRTHIDAKKSSENIVYKTMTSDAIEKIKKQEHRANTVGAFELVFDFQDLTREERENFNPSQYKAIITEYLEKSGISPRFELIGLTLHRDEQNPHFHAVFSGFDSIAQKFAVNDFFNPKNEKKQRINGLQRLQDDWGEFLQAHKMRHKKEHISALGFATSIYRRFDEETKQRLKLIRRAEKDRLNALDEQNDIKAGKLSDFIAKEALKVLKIAQSIQDEQDKERNKDKNKELKNGLYK